MALSSHALTTAKKVATELGVSGDDAYLVIEDLINEASEAIEQVCGGRHFEYGAEIVEKVEGKGGPRILLNRTPILSIDSIIETSQAGTTIQTIDASTYTIDDEVVGTVYREAGWPMSALLVGASQFAASNSGRKSLTVTYAGGWVTPHQADTLTDEEDEALVRTLPYDLERACILTAVSLYRRLGQDRQASSLQSTTTGITTSWNDHAGNSAIGTENPGILPLDAFAIVKRYRRVGIA